MVSLAIPQHHEVSEITEVASRPILQGGIRFWLIAGFFAIFVAAGIGAYAYQVMHGLGVTGYNDSVFWAVYESNLVAFIGISYGGAVTSALLRLAGAGWRAPIVRMAEAMALGSLCVGALFGIIHLGRPDRLLELFTRPHATSPIVWDFLAITTYIVATVVFLYLPLIPDLGAVRDFVGPRVGGWRLRVYRILALGWRDLPVQRRIVEQSMTVVAIVIIPLAVSVHSVLAWAFGVTVRVGWHSTILAPYFVVAALLSGVAAVILVVYAFRRAYHLEEYITVKQFRYLSYLMLALGLGYLYLTISEMLTESYVLDEQTAPLLQSMLIGSFSPFFWFFLIVGGAIPTLLVVLPWTRTPAGIALAALLTVVGMWVKRLVIVIPPLEQPVFDRVARGYQVSITEILVTLGATAAIPLLLMLFFRVFPILSIDEIHEVAEEELAAHHERHEEFTGRGPVRAEGGVR